MTSISVVPPASKTDEGGFALISVLVIAGFVALLTLALSTLVLGIAGDSAKLSSDVRIRALAEAGLNRMILAYSRPQDPLRTALVPGDRTVAWNFGGSTDPRCRRSAQTISEALTLDLPLPTKTAAASCPSPVAVLAA